MSLPTKLPRAAVDFFLFSIVLQTLPYTTEGDIPPDPDDPDLERYSLSLDRATQEAARDRFVERWMPFQDAMDHALASSHDVFAALPDAKGEVVVYKDPAWRIPEDRHADFRALFHFHTEDHDFPPGMTEDPTPAQLIGLAHTWCLRQGINVYAGQVVPWGRVTASPSASSPRKRRLAGS